MKFICADPNVFVMKRAQYIVYTIVLCDNFNFIKQCHVCISKVDSMYLNPYILINLLYLASSSDRYRILTYLLR